MQFKKHNIQFNIPDDEFVKFKKVNKVFVVFGLKRSGHHGIIEWMRQNLKKPTIYYNDVFEVGMHPHYFCADMTYENIRHQCYGFYDNVAKRFSDKFSKTNLPETMNSIIISFEEQPFVSFSNNDLKKLVNTVTDSYDVLIPVITCRDPFNTMASKEAGAKTNAKTLMLLKDELFCNAWKHHAVEMCYKKHFDNGVGIDYNLWLLDNNDYRKKKASELMLDSFEIDNPNVIGLNSSYDNDKKERSYYLTDKSKFLERYESLSKESYDLLINDKVLMLLCEKIYGKVFVEQISKYYESTITVKKPKTFGGRVTFK